MTKPAARCRYPILLLHGLLGFTQRSVGPWRISYFRQVVPFLEQAGNTVFTLQVHPVQSIEYRAHQIADSIQKHPVLNQSRINLIAHSMGGLDGRYLASCLDPNKQIVSLTTLATPHRGSLLADFFMQIPILKGLLRCYLPAIPNLTMKECLRFNEVIPDREDVLYQSISARCNGLFACPVLWPFWLFLRILCGANDGQVSEESAKWGKCLGTISGDHFELIGLHFGLNLFKSFDHLGLMSQITQVLSEKGL